MLLHVKRCVGLRSAHLFGKSDPYVTISVEGGESFKTRVTDNDNSPVIDEMYYIPGKTPMIRFTVLDADGALGGSDDFLGEFKLGFPKPVTSTKWRSVGGHPGRGKGEGGVGAGGASLHANQGDAELSHGLAKRRRNVQ